MHDKDAAFAIYKDRKNAGDALAALKKMGFAESAIRIFQSTRIGSKDFSGVSPYQIGNGAIVGAFVGATVVAILILFYGGELTGSQFLFAAVSSAFGGLVGAAGGAMVGIGTPDSAEKRYGQYLESGGVLLSVHLENSEQGLSAQELLTATGGQDVHIINELDTWESVNSAC